MPESSNKGGRKPRVTDEDLLDVFRSTSDPVLSTAEVADAVPIKRRGTLNRLQALKEDGELESKQIGGRNTVWWFVGGERITPDERAREEDAEKARDLLADVQAAVDAGDTHLSREPRDTTESPPEPETDQSPTDTPATPGAGEGRRELLVETLPGEGELLDRRVDVVMQMYEAIQDAEGSLVKTGELKELVDAEGVGYDSVGSFWTNAVKKNSTQNRPNSLTHLPNVEHIGNGRYRYTGGDR